MTEAVRRVILEFGGNDCDFNWAEISRKPMNRMSRKRR